MLLPEIEIARPRRVPSCVGCLAAAWQDAAHGTQERYADWPAPGCRAKAPLRPAAGSSLDARRLGAGPDGSRDAESGRDARRDALLSAALTTHVTTISSNSRTSECSLSYTNVKTLISCCAVRVSP